MNRGNESVDLRPDDGFQPSDYPIRPLLFGSKLKLSREQITSTLDQQPTTETEDGFRPSDYPMRPVVWPGPIQVNLNKHPQQQLLEQQTKKFRAEQGTRQKSSWGCVYMVEASEVEAVMAGRTG